MTKARLRKALAKACDYADTALEALTEFEDEEEIADAREVIRELKELTIERCKRCGKKWCGTDRKLRELYGEDYAKDGLDGRPERDTFGSKKCRDKGPKR